MLRETPGYPRSPHVPIELLEFDQAHLEQRLEPGTESETRLCWACGRQVTGKQLLCATHYTRYRAVKAKRNRDRRAKTFTIGTRDATRIHHAIDSLNELLGQLTTAYNTGDGDMRNEVDRVMRQSKQVVRVIIDAIPDPRV